MSNKKERKHDGVWDARRVLYNVLFYADEEGRLKYVTGDAESTNGIKRQRFNAALKAYETGLSLRSTAFHDGVPIDIPIVFLKIL